MFILMMTLSWPGPIWRQGHLWSLRLWNGENRKVHFFWYCCALWYKNAFELKPYEILEVKLFSNLGKWSLVRHLSTFLKDFSYYRANFNLIWFKSKFIYFCCCFFFWRRGKKLCVFGWDHMVKVAAMPIYRRNPKKVSFFRTEGLVALKLGM